MQVKTILIEVLLTIKSWPNGKALDIVEVWLVPKVKVRTRSGNKDVTTR